MYTPNYYFLTKREHTFVKGVINHGYDKTIQEEKWGKSVVFQNLPWDRSSHKKEEVHD